MKKLFVLSVGGSLVNPGVIDTQFLKKFKVLVENEVKKGNRFIIVVGGGKPARWYQDALKKISSSKAQDLDWMGIFATRLNAQLVRLMFGTLAHAKIIEDPNKKVVFKETILLAGGWMPGRSTDDDAVRLAKMYGSKTVINLSNIDYAYTKDPKKFKDAKKIVSISWENFKKIVGSTWKPGTNAPFDPIASKLAQQENMTVIIANGKNLSNLKNILEGKKFNGTVIR